MRKIWEGRISWVTLVPQECAHLLFVLLNTQIKTVNANNTFFAMLMGKDEKAVYLRDYLHDNNIEYEIRGRKADYRFTVVPGSMYKRLKKYGENIWTSCMNHMLDCYDGEKTSMEDTFQNGFFSFYMEKMVNSKRINWGRIKKHTAFATQKKEAIINAKLRANSGGLKDGIKVALLEQEGNY